MNRYQCNNHRSGRCDKVMEGNLSSTAPDGVAPFGHFRFYQELLRVQCWDYCCSYLLALHIVSVKYTSSFMHHVKTICQTKFQLPVSQMGGFLRDDITANIDGSKIKSEFIERYVDVWRMFCMQNKCQLSCALSLVCRLSRALCLATRLIHWQGKDKSQGCSIGQGQGFHQS